MDILIIAAVAKNGVIGNKGKIPWHFSEDFKHFKRVTTGHAVIMGRATYDSIGKPLPDRLNIVLSKHPPAPDAPYKGASSIEQALGIAQRAGKEKAFIIGGGKVYAEAMEKQLADTLLITEIKQEYPGDAFFPTIDEEEWEETAREPSAEFDIVTYRRRQL